MPPSHADDDDDLLAMIVSVKALLGTPDSWDAPGGYGSVGHEARMLEHESVAVPTDLAAAGEDRLHHLRTRWSTVPGQASGVSWRAFCMLVGLAEVKPDRMIRRYVATALGRPGESAVGVEEARDLVMATAALLGVSPRDLDYAIWSYQSGG